MISYYTIPLCTPVEDKKLLLHVEVWGALGQFHPLRQLRYILQECEHTVSTLSTTSITEPLAPNELVQFIEDNKILFLTEGRSSALREHYQEALIKFLKDID